MELDFDRAKIQKKQVLHKFSNGDVLQYEKRGIWIAFHGKRRVLSTSVLCGGIREDLEGVFNYNCLGAQYAVGMMEDTYEKELLRNAGQLGINRKKVTGLSTAAWMEFVAIQSEAYKGLEVTAIVTGGIDKNAVRAGDNASYYEESGHFYMIDTNELPTPGTINILLYINRNLDPGTLTRTLVTCSEAKVVAVQELMIGSLYSHGMATGSGTDGTIVICDSESEVYLTDAGEHSKLGELIGKTVKKAVKEALYLQTGACAPRQHAITERGRRYGITLGSLWSCYQANQKMLQQFTGRTITLEEFEQEFTCYNTNSSAIVWLSLYLHLLDQYEWGMLKWGEIERETRQLTRSLLQLHEEPVLNWVFEDKDEITINWMVEGAKRSILAAMFKL